MKKSIGLIISAILCMLCAIPAFAAAPNEDSMFASAEIVNKIQADIPSQEIESWTGLANSSMDLQYVVPVYTTLGVNDNSVTLKETLAFTDGYNIPVIADGECVGTFNVVKYNGKWTVNSYTIGLDFKTAVEQRLNSSWSFVEIPQLGGDFGFLTYEGDSENYQSISSIQSILTNENTGNILQQIKEYNGGADSEGVALMANESQNNLYVILLIGIVLCASIATIYVLKKQNKMIS